MVNYTFSVDELFAPVSREIAKVVFNEQQGRTLSQKVEDELKIPKPFFHTLLFFSAIAIFSNWKSEVG